MPLSPTAPDAVRTAAAQYWESHFSEPVSLPLAVPREDGFYSPPPTLSTRYARLPLHEHKGLEIRYAISRRLKTSVSGFPLYKLSVHIVNSKTGEIVGYIRALKVGPGLTDAHYLNLGQVGGSLSADFGSAMVTMQTNHVSPSELLREGLRTHSMVYIELFEVASSHRGHGIGTAAVSALVCALEEPKRIGFFMYRPYPCQYLRTDVHDCVFSHDERAVAEYARFCRATAAVSRHYAREWAAQRIPGSEYFVASIGAGFSFGFNALLEQWALLPNG